MSEPDGGAFKSKLIVQPEDMDGKRRGPKPKPPLTDGEIEECMKQVATLAAQGLSKTGIRAALKLTRRDWEQIGDGFVRQFEEEFDIGHYAGEAKMAEVVFRRGLAGDLKAAMFYLTHVHKWSYRQEISVNVDSQKSTDDLKNELAMLMSDPSVAAALNGTATVVAEDGAQAEVPTMPDSMQEGDER